MLETELSTEELLEAKESEETSTTDVNEAE